MKRLGTVLHSVDNIMIVRADKTLESTSVYPNSLVITKTMKRIGKIKELFGPEKNPYISIKLFNEIRDSEIMKLRKERVYLG